MGRRKLTGRFDAQAVSEVETRKGKFDIKVKDDDQNVVFEATDVEFDYPYIPSLETALRAHGADLNDDQVTFLQEALKGSEATGKAVLSILKILNDEAEAKAQRNAYSALYQQKKPKSVESMTNTWAGMIRGFVSNTPGATVQSAIDTFKVAVPGFPQDFTVAQYESARLPGRKAS